MVTDKWFDFVSHVIEVVADVLGILLWHARTKIPQLNVMLKKIHATIETSSKTASSRYRKQLLRLQSLAFLNNNNVFNQSSN